MTINCPTCNTELSDNHPASAIDKLLNWVEVNGGWSNAFEGYSVGEEVGFVPMIEVAAIKLTYDTGDVDVDGYSGESCLPQGATFTAYIVLKIGELFYRITGIGDSYGEVVWNSSLHIVTATPKTVWEFK